jgi:hypothetical protein
MVRNPIPAPYISNYVSDVPSQSALYQYPFGCYRTYNIPDMYELWWHAAVASFYTQSTVSGQTISEQDEIEDLREESLEPFTLPSVQEERKKHAASSKPQYFRRLLTSLTDLLTPR